MTLLSLEEARERILARVPLLETVRMPIDDALHHTLTEPIRSDIDDPPFDKAVMDGFAVRAADVANAPARLRVVGVVGAGHRSDRAVAAGEAVRINTGAPIPTGTDAVVRVEETQSARSRGNVGTPAAPPGELDEVVIIQKSVPKGNFITRRGAHVRRGAVVLERKVRLTPLAMGAAAAAGATEVTVHRAATIAVLSTGDELVPIDRVPHDAQIRNSNEVLLTALIRSARAVAKPLGIAGDDRGALRARIQEGLKSDVLCITGGVSMGSFDYVPEVLKACGAVVHVHKVAIKPGRPILFATAPDGTPVFALPGNPASAFVGFALFVRPALAVMEGGSGKGTVTMIAELKGTVAATRDRRTFLPACARVASNGHWSVEPLSWHGSGDAFGMARANALIDRPTQAPKAGGGEPVSILPLDWM